MATELPAHRYRCPRGVQHATMPLARLLGWVVGLVVFTAGVFGVFVSAASTASASAGGAPAYLVVGRQANGRDVVETLNSRGRVLRVLGQTGGSWAGPAEWTPDRRRAVWLGPRGVTIGNVDGGGQRVLAPVEPRGCSTNCADQSFDLSPDGKSVLVSGVGPGGTELATISTSTGRGRVLARGGADTGYAVSGGWSPNGKTILYVRAIFGDKPENYLVLAHADGKDARIVMRLRNPAEGPLVSWAPNGREISFFEQSGSGSNGHTSVGVLDLASGRIHTIHVATSLQSPPVWAPNSQKMALSGTYARTIILEPDATPIRRLRFLADQLEWTSAGLCMLRGPHDTAVYLSRGGRQRPRLLFTMPRFESIVTFVPR